MPYWIARLLGLADGPAVARCMTCKELVARESMPANGFCSLECVGEWERVAVY